MMKHIGLNITILISLITLLPSFTSLHAQKSTVNKSIVSQSTENAAQEKAALLPVIEEYIVQPGDTLANLARKYLGNEVAWDINININSELANPNNLTVGERVKIITGFKAPEPIVEEIEVFQATIQQTSNSVDKNLKQTNWELATTGDQLQPLDGIRTAENSSALLKFDGKNEIQLTEHSQVFLRAHAKQESGITRNEIEITQGEAQLNLAQDTANISEFEINTAGIITRPAFGDNQTSELRARVDEKKQTQVMVYNGTSAVESAGVSVDVATGMGTIAIPGEAPAKPEKLLEAPELVLTNSEVEPNNITVQWNSNEPAKFFRLEVCKDRRCLEPVLSESQIQKEEFTIENLAVGNYYWRVTPVSQSGLDGFTSNATLLKVTAAKKQDWTILLYIAGLIILLISGLLLATQTYNE